MGPGCGSLARRISGGCVVEAPRAVSGNRGEPDGQTLPRWPQASHQWRLDRAGGTDADPARPAQGATAVTFRLNGEPDEDALQESIADLLDWILPDEVVWSHFPAGGYQLSKAAAARLYRLGLKRGIPDICVWYAGGRTLGMEVKTRRGVASTAQKGVHARLQAAGHPVVIVRCVEDVLAALRTYGVPYLKARLAEGYRGTQVVGSGTQATPSRAA